MWLEWFAIPSPFAEGPRVRIRFPPAASPLQTGLPPLEFPPCDRLSDPVGAISARAVVGLRVRSLIEPHGQRDPTAFRVDIHHFDTDNVARLRDFARVFDLSRARAGWR